MSREPWHGLVPGDRFTIDSNSGNSYELTFLAAAANVEGGLFLRFGPNRLGRFYPERLNWQTLEKLLPVDALLPGDEILVTPKGAAECRGRIVTVSDDRISLSLPNGQVIAIAREHSERQSIRILMAASDWRKGDEFIVMSKSGREYPGDDPRRRS